jgi:hypothetical protein
LGAEQLAEPIIGVRVTRATGATETMTTIKAIRDTITTEAMAYRSSAATTDLAAGPVWPIRAIMGRVTGTATVTLTATTTKSRHRF